MKKGFTLVELLITATVAVVLSGFFIIYLNPLELLRQARDQRRISDLGELTVAVQYYANATTSPDMDGPRYTNSCKGDTAQRFFVSVPLGDPGTPPNLPTNWTLTQAPSTILTQVSGAGWMPLDLTTMNGGSPLAVLPVDPTNTFTNQLFYSYTCRATGDFELTAYLESKRYGIRGTEPKASTDGGTDPTLYEVGTDLTLDPLSPVGYWSFDEGQGVVANDASGNGDTGLLCEAGTCSMQGPEWISGHLNSALNFDGNTDWINVANAPVLQLDQRQTVAVWTSVLFTAPGARIIGKGVNGCQNYALWVNSQGNVTYQVDDASGVTGAAQTSDTINQGSWRFIAGTYDGATVRVYLDGVEKASAPFVRTSLCASTDPLTMGYAGFQSKLKGSLDEVRVYRRALSGQEILNLYNATQ